jgi:hypothetical protein
MPKKLVCFFCHLLEQLWELIIRSSGIFLFLHEAQLRDSQTRCKSFLAIFLVIALHDSDLLVRQTIEITDVHKVPGTLWRNETV